MMRGTRHLILAACLMMTAHFTAAQTCNAAAASATSLFAALRGCDSTSDCLNGDLRSDEFQPPWVRERRHNVDKGLACIEGSCRERLEGGSSCTGHVQCKSRRCLLVDAATDQRRCFDEESVPLGERCPQDHDQLIRPLSIEAMGLCEKHGHCFQVDDSLTLGEGASSCRRWDEEGEACHVVWDPLTSRPYGDTCNPELGEIYCQPHDPTFRPTGTRLVDLMAPGTCVQLLESEEGSTCAVIQGTNVQRPCEYDQYCDESTCKELVDKDEPCTTHTACEYQYGCNAVTGRCEKIFDVEAEDEKAVSDGVFCKYGHVRDATSGRCVRYLRGNSCLTDAQCVNPAEDTTGTNLFSWGFSLYCNNVTNTCEDWIPNDKCEDPATDYFKFWFQELKEGRLQQVHACEEDGCLSLRVILRRMKTVASGLMCCIYRETEDGTCLKQDDRVYLPLGYKGPATSSQGGLWIELDNGDYFGEICGQQGLQAFEIGILSALFAFLGLVTVFILVKEFVLYKPEEKSNEGDDDGEKNDEDDAQEKNDEAGDAQEEKEHKEDGERKAVETSNEPFAPSPHPSSGAGDQLKESRVCEMEAASMSRMPFDDRPTDSLGGTHTDK